ncbi:MAG: integrin alpha [Planctomycetota bacterium]
MKNLPILLALRRSTSLLVLCALASLAGAQPGTVLSSQKISSSTGGFAGPLDDYDEFGTCVASLGDLNGDTLGDIVVGVDGDDDGGLECGAVWILFLATNGTVKGEAKISMTAGGFRGILAPDDYFGSAVTSLGDFDGSGTYDIAVGAWGDDGIGFNRGAVWLLGLNTDGSASAEREIADRVGGLGGVLKSGDRFGSAVAYLGDLDGDGVGELAVGAPGDDSGGVDHGAVWVLFLDSTGYVKAKAKISDLHGAFGGDLDDEDRFGSALGTLGDLDRDGVVDLAVGAPGDDDGGTDRGAVWVLFLSGDGTVKDEQKISAAYGGFGGALADYDQFGTAVTQIADHDGDTVTDVVVGAPADGDGGPLHGAIWVLFLDVDGTVRYEQKISETAGGFEGPLGDLGRFGSSLAFLDDHDRDGVGDIACGARFDNDGGAMRGAVWILFLDGTPEASAAPRFGLGINADILTNVTLPVLGQTWIAELDAAGHDPSICGIMGGDTPMGGLVLGIGEILVDFFMGNQLIFTVLPHASGVVTFQHPIPLDVSFGGFAVYTQGLVLGTPGANLSNGIDLVLGK